MDQNLIQVVDGNIFTTSQLVAEKFGKNHHNVLRKIDSLISEIEANSFLNSPRLFEKSEYLDSQGKNRPMYRMTRDGFTLLAMGFTGSDALVWKLKYIEAFNEMERRLRGSSVPVVDNRLQIARLISRTPYRNLPAVKELYPEYFRTQPEPDSFEYTVDENTSYQKWIEDYGISKEWIGNFPTTDVYLSYKSYCVENNFIGMGKKVFFHTLEEDFRLRKKQQSNGHRYFISA